MGSAGAGEHRPRRESCQSGANWLQADGSITHVQLTAALALLPGGSRVGLLARFKYRTAEHSWADVLS